MKFDDFLAQGHAWPKPWAWGLEFTVTPTDGTKPWKTIWRHSIYSTKAEVEALKREIKAQGWLRPDGKLRVVRVYFTWSADADV